MAMDGVTLDSSVDKSEPRATVAPGHRARSDYGLLMVEIAMPTECSFCGRRQNEGKKMVAGSGACICEDCVALCAEIFASPAAGLQLTRATERPCQP